MNNIANEERILKRYLKKKMSFNQESVVKFLITGLIGITMNTESSETIPTNLYSLNPTIYSNLGRQIFDKGKTFEKYTNSTISNFGEDKFNVATIGDFSRINSINNIEGYKSKLVGFVGVGELMLGMYGTIGYAYDKIDYDGNNNEKTQSIHLGINKLGKVEEINYGLALSGEYNFNEGERSIPTLERIAKSNFDSYRIGANGNIFREFGLENDSYLKPFISLELAYGAYDSFIETQVEAANTKIDKKNYVSVLPKVGVMFVKNINVFELYTSADYSYQLGNLDSSQEFYFDAISNEKFYLAKDSLESGTTTLKAGMNYCVNNINLFLNYGKEFGKRDNAFIGAGSSYNF
ncbi:MAG: autotransporter outer membrane beta-barrel domain-containing protein [Fusobacteriaceae bacterium]